MSRLQIELPDGLQARVERLADDAGFATAEEYVRAMVIADAVEGDAISEDSLEELLLERVNESDAGEVTDEFFDEIRRQVRNGGGAGKRIGCSPAGGALVRTSLG